MLRIHAADMAKSDPSPSRLSLKTAAPRVFSNLRSENWDRLLVRGTGHDLHPSEGTHNYD
jgi:hypothetical protein